MRCLLLIPYLFLILSFLGINGSCRTFSPELFSPKTEVVTFYNSNIDYKKNETVKAQSDFTKIIRNCKNNFSFSFGGITLENLKTSKLNFYYFKHLNFQNFGIISDKMTFLTEIIPNAP